MTLGINGLALPVPENGTDHADKELAAAILHQFEQFPGSHEQGAWARRLSAQMQAHVQEVYGHTCHTTMCVAGWATQLKHPESSPVFDLPTLSVLITPGRSAGSIAYSVQYPDGSQESYERAGRAALNLTDDEACWLFDTDRTRGEVIDALETLAEFGYLGSETWDEEVGDW